MDPAVGDDCGERTVSSRSSSFSLNSCTATTNKSISRGETNQQDLQSDELHAAMPRPHFDIASTFQNCQPALMDNATQPDLTSELEPNESGELDHPPFIHPMPSCDNTEGQTRPMSRYSNACIEFEAVGVCETASSSNLGAQKWQPFWLSTVVLGVFATLFGLLLLAVILLYYFSEKFNGLATQKPEYQYAWRYGPTILFMIVNTLWRQVDFFAKLLSPWSHLHTDITAPEKAMPLNYLTPILPMALWTAMKNRDLAVVLTLLGQVIITITVALSTGLFNIVPTEVTEKRSDFQLKSEFKLRPDIFQSSEWAPGYSAVQIYTGIQRYGLSYPPGTSNSILTLDIKSPDVSPTIINYTIPAETMHFEVDCEVIPITTDSIRPHRFEDESMGSRDMFVSDVNIPGCVIHDVEMALPYSAVRDYGKDAIVHLRGEFGWHICNTGKRESFRDSMWDLISTTENGSPSINNGDEDLRLIFAVSEVGFPDYHTNITRITAVSCQLSYYIQQFDVHKPNSTDRSAYATKPSEQIQPVRKLEGLSNSTFAKAMWSATQSSLPFRGENNGIFQIMANNNGYNSVEPFLNADILITNLKTTFNGVASQLMRQIALHPADQRLSGHITYTTFRLKATMQSAIPMCVLLGILCIITVCIILFRPDPKLSFPPTSLAAAAVLLADDQYGRMLECLKTSSMNENSDQTKSESRLVHYRETTMRSSAHRKSSSKQTLLHSRAGASTDVSWWRPPSSNNWYFALIIGLALLSIAILELLQHFSDENSGIINLGPDDEFIFTTYIATALALMLGMLYNGYEFTVKLLTPFITLKQGKSEAASLSCVFVGKLLPAAAYSAVRTKKYSVLTALLGSSICGFLTIAVSGLYTSVNVSRIGHIKVSQTDELNLGYNNSDPSGEESFSGVVASLVEFEDLNYTRWTYEDLVFPHLSQTEFSLAESIGVSLQVKVPAVRPKLDCIEADLEDLLDSEPIAYSNNQGDPPLLDLSISLLLSEWCEGSIPGYDADTIWMFWTGSYLSSNDDHGYIYDGGPTLYRPTDDNAGKTFTSPFGAGAGCSSFWATAGSFKLIQATTNFTTHIDGYPSIPDSTAYSVSLDAGLLLCYQNYERVQTRTTFRLPDFDIDVDHPPQTDESTGTLLKTPGGSSRFESLISLLENQSWGNDLGPRTKEQSSPLSDSGRSFIRALTKGRNGKPMAEIAGKANINNLYTAANRLYKTYTVQAMSLSMRANISGNETSTTNIFDGSFQTGNSRRIQQNRNSKLALQIMLAVMALCTIITRLLLPLGEVLLRDPCSIVGIASLLVGGSLLAKPDCSLPSHSLTEKELVNRFQGRTYSLKWWTTRDGKTRYGIDRDLEDDL
ncbi:hypothetical protein B0I35DRAFT_375387 [Stachybotrys elegans]|uniref:Uncharacterized protein n=1 Tax=Stachybotrys elegans TaxID=80388 RepID=A0A8K0WQ58_9HYPO|nr:hypothetical protein B0I35DRAFT_375387 [Stachybotrys elegans]